MNDAPSSVALHGDRALGVGDTDRLGFREVASRLAPALAGPAIRGTFVMGLEGKWGSGKSSLLHMLREELDALRPDSSHSVIAFEPWLVGNRDALVGALFTSLLAAIGKVETERGDATRETTEAARRASEAARSFVVALGRFGGVVEVAGTASGVVPIGLFGKGLKALAGAVARGKQAAPLTQHKRKLVEALQALNHRFIVTIDDLDRLDPAEALEVLRLTRSVADLPGVVYVLCYDGDVLARSIERSASVEDGRAYLEKIVQTTVMVPRPEVFQLRHWLADELKGMAAPLDQDALERLRRVVDAEGGRQLGTPRNVNRVLDSMRILWPVLKANNADFPDLLWLQLVKDGAPGLYRWIEEYCAIQAEVSLGVARTGEQEQTRLMEELVEAAGDGRFDDLYYRHFFAEQLPGVESDYGNDTPPIKLFGQVRSDARDKAIASSRLKSPDHYRLYFALAQPSHALTTAEMASFWAAVDAGVEETSAALMALHLKPTARNSGKADLLLDRLGVVNAELLTPKAAEHILLALADTIDAAYEARPYDRDWVFSLDDRADRAVPAMLARLAERRGDVVDRMFRRGSAIAWLTGVYRHDVFSQGRFGGEEKPRTEWLLTSPELDLVQEVMTARYRAMTFDEVLATRSRGDCSSLGFKAATRRASRRCYPAATTRTTRSSGCWRRSALRSARARAASMC